MSEYHKIQTVFKRDMSSKFKTLLEGQWTLDEFEYLSGNEWEFTEKVDGTNIRIMWDGENVTFGGRTDAAQIPAPLVTALNDMFLSSTRRGFFAEHFAGGCVLYGEGYGSKIQKGGGLYRPDQSFVLFDVRVGAWWLQRKDVDDVAKVFGIESVPIIGSGTLFDAIAAAKSGITSRWGDFEAEGIVARPRVELCTRGGQRIITKIKCTDFWA